MLRILPRTEWNRPQYTSMVETSVECLAEEDLWDGICPICQKGESETHQHMMVGCDACNNWFHFECVNYNATGSEDAAWFCPQCIATGLVPQTARLQDTKASRSRRR
ncbi:PHD-finger domain-containing protein [Cardiosporidium cionae]|uniref:PHD-finger domain-containing protein n=1 Tax=Cardiosporidium cionae TaxID=476202 RepID=A0ABQ7J3V2_9APIC|nr:PHD-finger domain-containing protein [Cardiosporidium cionae]|eukprot:KAF8817783.1 PHD-finger domain-containing protein [Cardiosporidium cionae]